MFKLNINGGWITPSGSKFSQGTTIPSYSTIGYNCTFGRNCEFGVGCATQPAGAQQPDTAYADLMQEASDWICEHVENGTPGVMMWAIRLQSAAQNLRASHGQAPAQQRHVRCSHNQGAKMKVKISELTGPALDWAVAKCEGIPVARHNTGAIYLIDTPWADKSRVKWLAGFSPSKHWAQGGPIIARCGTGR